MSASAKVLVFGAGGQVGRELTQRPAPASLDVVGLSHQQADVRDRNAVARAVDHYRPGVIVNAAAFTAVDKAETEPATAFDVNDHGARNLAAAAKDIGAVLVHLSTDYVFDGTKPDPYVEDDPIAPLGCYGRSKAAGEAAVRETLDRHLILRTAWVYAAHGHNFLRTMLRLAREREVVRVVNDQHGTPTAAADLADAILALAPRLAASATFGTYHLTNAGRTTWHGFAQEIFVSLARHGARVPRLEAIATSDYPTPARRPAHSVLDCGKIAGVYAIGLRPWEAALRETVDALLAAETARGAA